MLQWLGNYTLNIKLNIILTGASGFMIAFLLTLSFNMDMLKTCKSYQMVDNIVSKTALIRHIQKNILLMKITNMILVLRTCVMLITLTNSIPEVALKVRQNAWHLRRAGR